MTTLEKSVVKLILDNKIFYSTILAKMRRIEDCSIPTLGVAIVDGQLVLAYNPTFVEEIYSRYSIKGVLALLEHEILHIVYEHVLYIQSPEYDTQTYNIATDITINQYIKNLTPNALYPKDFKLPNGKDSIYYYHKLLQTLTKQGIERRELDDHSRWGATSGNKQLSREIVKQTVSEALSESKKFRGFIPSHLETQIEELLKEETIPWNQLLRQYVSSSIKTSYRSSWKRPNRRYGEEVKGKVPKRTLRILLAIDTSGSVSSDDFVDFIAEIKGIMKCYKSKIKVVECDTQIQSEFDLKPYSKLTTKFVGRGGTSYKPVFTYLKKNPEYHLLIYFTDLYCDFDGIESVTTPIVWVLSSNGNSSNIPPLGKVVQIQKGD